MTRTYRLVFCLAAFALALATPRPAAALEFTPFMGVVHPLKPEFLDFAGPTPVIELVPSTAYGVRLGGRVSPRVGLEASLASSGTNMRIGGAVQSAGTLFQGDGRIRLRLNSPAASQHFDLIGGAGVSDAQVALTDFLARSGIKRKMRVAWVAGLGATLPVFPSAGLRMDFEDHVHSSHLHVDQTSTGGLSYKDRMQHDLMFTMGVVVPLGQR